MSNDMRREVIEIKEMVVSLEATAGRLDSTLGRVDATLNRVVGTVANLVGVVADMNADMATRKDISNLNERMDGFAGLLLDSRHRWAVHAETLVKHDERLAKLESLPKI